MKKWSEESSDFLDALGGNAVNPLNTRKEKTSVKKVEKPEPVKEEVVSAKKKITTIHIEEDTYRRFKKFSVENGQSITDLLKAAMLDMLDGVYYPRGLKG